MNRRRSISVVEKQRMVEAYNIPNADYVKFAEALVSNFTNKALRIILCFEELSLNLKNTDKL